jgi:hypothetical protein
MTTLYKSLLHTDWCSEAWSSLLCLVTASNSVASSASVSNSTCPHWLAPFSCSFQDELASNNQTFVTSAQTTWRTPPPSYSTVVCYEAVA